ncbi:MAG: hypothetical protein E6H54_01230 [Betaproteobacteria bacterium]|nr:MAG: hypothetical protein E6H54_01230 [Betaproteobacteria bacterium]
MDTHALHHYPARAELSRWLVVGFLAGAAAVLLFHQSALTLLHSLQLARSAPFSFTPTKPFGVPLLWSLAFWGGVWGVVFAAALARLDGARLMVAATVLGAIAPTLVAWFVVAPLKGQPVAAGWAPAAMAVGPIVNGAWGLGTGIGLYLFGRRRH